MKKTLLSIMMGAACIAAHAQAPTLTAATNNPVAGDVFYGHITNTTGIDKGAAGAGVSWNFSALVEVQKDTTTYMSCASTPHCDSFAGSNIVAFDNTDYVYGTTSAASFVAIGAYDGSYRHFTRPQHLMSFPLTYTTARADTAAFTLVGTTGTIYFSMADSAVADAYGTLVLPTGTYNNALRVHTISVLIDSVNFMGVPLVMASATETYSWYAAGFHSPLLSITYDTAGTGTPAVSDVKYYSRPASSATGNVQLAAGALQLYPNPASSVVYAKFELADNAGATAVVTDVMGRVVNTISNNELKKGANELAVPVANLADGMYIVRIQSASGVMSQKFTVRK